MRARLVDVDAQEWATLLCDVRHDVYSQPAFVALEAWNERGLPAGVLVGDERHGRLLLPIVIRDVDTAHRDAVSPYGYPGVVTDRPGDASFVREAMGSCRALLASEGMVSLFVRLHPLLPVAGLDGLDMLVRRPTVAIDLALPEEEVWAGFRRNHRQDILRAQQRGARVETDDADAAYASFQELYGQTMVRLGASGSYRYCPEYFARLRQALGDQLHILSIHIGDALAAAALVTECGGIVQIHLAANDELHAALRPTKLLVFECYRWARRRGDRWVHLGGGRGSAEDSLFHFKVGFSPQRAEFASLRMVILPDAYRSLTMRLRPGADPGDLTGYFPAYRAPVETPCGEDGRPVERSVLARTV